MLAFIAATLARSGLLHPQESESREIKELGGLWNFRADPGTGMRDRWQESGVPPPTQYMPVPSSYNDLTQDQHLREHVGIVWYERTTFLPLHWMTQRVVLFVGSANHHAVVWLNGKFLGEHEGGHLPFHLPLDPLHAQFGRSNRLTIALNNTLSTTTIPPGFVQVNAAGRRIQRLQMDFFHYAGLHRQVLLYTTPAVGYLDDILLNCRLDGATAHLNVFVSAVSAPSPPPPPDAAADEAAASEATVLITLKDKADRVVARGRMPSDPRRGGRLQVHDAQLWWPRYMSESPGYLYTIIIEVLDTNGNVSDVYRLRYGLRTVEVSAEMGFLINSRPFYFHGFGKHEDSELRGRALDLPQLIKDQNLMHWIGANSVRTTHYPYSSEFLSLCDELGVVVIGEAPAVGLQAVNMVRETLRTHLEVMGELITRDKNHPSVVMWSVANEPDSEVAGAATYFKHLVAQTRALDPSRPVTFATFKSPDKDVAVQHVDVIMANRYHAWYTNTGQLDIIHPSLRADLLSWRRNFRKPIMISEYGADSVAGIHADPPIAFSEEFQAQYLEAHYSVFDELKQAGLFIGEHVWNFADFMTSQGVTRVVGNRKGVFTRGRQPKLAAHTLRARYEFLANQTRLWPLSLAQLDALDKRIALEQGGGGGGGGSSSGSRGNGAAFEQGGGSRMESSDVNSRLLDAAALGSDDGAADAEMAEAAAAVAAATGQLEEEEAAMAEADAARAGGGMGPTHVWAEG